MTSNIRLDSMGVNKQILLDLFLSFGLTTDKEENIKTFVSEMHTKLGLSNCAYITQDGSNSFIAGPNKPFNLDFNLIQAIASSKKMSHLNSDSTKNKQVPNLLDKNEEALIYRTTDNSFIFIKCDKARKLVGETALEQLLDRFSFFISQLEPKVESKLNQLDPRLTNVVDDLDQDIIVISKDFNIQYFNACAKKSFKRTFNIELILGENIFQVGSAGFGRHFKPLIKRVLEGEEMKLEYSPEDRTTKGKFIHVIITFKPITNEANEIIGLFSSSEDVTELVERNQKLEQREYTLKTILDSTPDGIYSLDKNLEVLVINEQAKKDFKYYSKVDLKTGDNLHDKIPKEILDQWKEKYFNKVFNNESFVVNASMEHKEKNQTFFVENRYLPVKDGEGEIFAMLEVCRDVTELTNKERDLEYKESELRSLLEKTPTAIAKVGLNGRIKFITERTGDILGLKEDQILNKSILEIIHPSEHKSFMKDVQDLLDGKEEVGNTYRAIHPKKENFYVNGVASISKDINDEPYEFFIAFNNISEKVIAQHNLEKSRKRYKSILEGSPAGLAQVNEEGKFTFVSTKGAEILGSNIEEILSKGFLDYINDNHKEKVKSNLATLTKPNQLIDFRVKGKSDLGNTFYLDGTATLLKDDDAGMSTLFIFNDVTSRVNAEKELAIYNAEVREKSAIYKALIDRSFDGIDIIELKPDMTGNDIFNGEIIIRNDKMKEYFDHSPKAFIKTNEILKISPEFQANGIPTDQVFQKVIQENISNKEYNCDWRININDKLEDFHFASKIILLEDKIILIRNLRKVTESKKQQETIQKQLKDLSVKNDQLEKYIQSNLQLENFAYIASHDLKAPLRTVSSFAFLLKQKVYKNLDEKSQGYLDIVLRSSTNMQKLIDDLLAFSRVGTQKVNYKKILLAPMIKRILLDLDSNIRESNAEVIINELPEIIFADESLMIQIFLNLIGNSLKFVEKGTSPIVEISHIDQGSHWKFSIKDNGIGVKMESSSKIFGIFEKLHSNDIYEGTGLGLSICKKIIDIHHGEILVKSELGQGSTFEFTIKKDLSLKE